MGAIASHTIPHCSSPLTKLANCESVSESSQATVAVTDTVHYKINILKSHLQHENTNFGGFVLYTIPTQKAVVLQILPLDY